MVFIYLDQWVWIRLLRCRNEMQPEHPELDDALNRVMETSEKGTHIFPLSFYHWIETGKRGRVASKKELFKFMFTVSDFNTISPWVTILEHEVRNAIHRTLGTAQADLTDIVFIRGFEGVLGGKAKVVYKNGRELEKEYQEKLDEYLTDPEKMAEFMLSVNDDRVTHETDEGFSKLAKWTEEYRSEEYGTKDKKLRRNIAYLRFFGDIIAPKLVKYLLELGIDPLLFKRTHLDTSDKVIEFIKLVPTGYIVELLNYENLIDFSREVTTNDLYDIWAVSIAIPYCDMVVIERRWANILKQHRVDKEYSTRITHSINELKEI